jgi:hypothetical protein
MTELSQHVLSFSQSYNELPEGIYKSVFQHYLIEKIKLEPDKCPTSVNQDTGVVRINTNLSDISVSGRAFFLFWAFKRFSCKSDIEADTKAFELIKEIPELSMKDASKDFCEALSDSDESIKRLKNIIQ